MMVLSFELRALSHSGKCKSHMKAAFCVYEDPMYTVQGRDGAKAEKDEEIRSEER